MQKSLKLLTIILSIVLLNLSCRQEEFEYFPPEDQPTLANTMVADLLERTALNDGSIDNIIDRSNCFTVQLPVTVKVNGLDVLVDSVEDFANIEAIFDEFDDDTDILEIMFPITIVLSDFTEVAVADLTEFNAFSSGCNGENVDDDDIECLDIQYPITASIFNQTTESFDNLSINSDWQLYNFIDDLKSDDIVNISFPINVVLADGVEVSIGSLTQLEEVIDNAKDSCDEDDDYDFNDDDCDNCTTTQLSDILIECLSWTIDKLERNSNDLEDLYIGYQFSFIADGTLSASSNGSTFSGTWESNGTGNSIAVTLNIPNLSDFNDTWNLHEIDENGGQKKVDLRIGDNDRLRLESACSGNGGTGTSGTLGTLLSDGLWVVGSYLEDTNNQTNIYNGYTVNFNNDGTVVADNGSSINGTWSVQNSDSELVLDFGSTVPFNEFNDSWDVISSSATQIELRDVSGGNGGTDTLIFNKQ
jgi:hypothetical protein